MASPLQAHLRKFRTQVERALDGEGNVKVYIFIADELPEPIPIQMGKGENELVIDIEEDHIDYKWTKKTFWKKTKDFFSDDARKIVEGLRLVLDTIGYPAS